MKLWRKEKEKFLIIFLLRIHFNLNLFIEQWDTCVYFKFGFLWVYA